MVASKRRSLSHGGDVAAQAALACLDWLLQVSSSLCSSMTSLNGLNHWTVVALEWQCDNAWKVPQNSATACASFQLLFFTCFMFYFIFMNVLTFPFWKVFSHLSCPLCHMYYSLICDTSSPYSTFLPFLYPQQLFSTIHDPARSTGHFHTLWPVKSQSHVSLSPSSTLSPSKKSVRHSRATLKLPSCFISQITKVSKVSQRGRDSLSKGGMQTDLSVYEFYKYLLWGSYCPIAGCEATEHNAKS